MQISSTVMPSAIIDTTVATGARRGELCGLRWSHVDLPSGVLTYRSAIAQDGRHREEEETKTQSVVVLTGTGRAARSVRPRRA